jgi:nucleoside-diphosphate-sugar epimerase
MSNYLITGSAGFIASRICDLLLQAGHTVLGIDNLNPAYDVRMKQYRLDRLLSLPAFTFMNLDIADPQPIPTLNEPLL